MVALVSAPARRAARRALDRRFTDVRSLARHAAVPRGGWTRAVREALGMSQADLGRRMGVNASTVMSLERGEREGRVQLDTLRRAADALDCDLVYALVPRRPLESAVQDRARRKAFVALAPVTHSMLLEDQQVLPDAMQAQLDEQTVRLVDRPGLWRDV